MPWLQARAKPAFLSFVITRTSENDRASISRVPSVEALSTTMSSSSAEVVCVRSDPRQLRRWSAPFQLAITTLTRGVSLIAGRPPRSRRRHRGARRTAHARAPRVPSRARGGPRRSGERRRCRSRGRRSARGSSEAARRTAEVAPAQHPAPQRAPRSGLGVGPREEPVTTCGRPTLKGLSAASSLDVRWNGKDAAFASLEMTELQDRTQPKERTLVDAIRGITVLARARIGRGTSAQGFYAQRLSFGALAFDIGAFRGQHTAAMLKRGARVVALEPQGQLARRLERDFPTATVLTLGVSDKPGQATLLTSSAYGDLASLNPEQVNDPFLDFVEWD